jgi:hypothetical protein
MFYGFGFPILFGFPIFRQHLLSKETIGGEGTKVVRADEGMGRITSSDDAELIPTVRSLVEGSMREGQGGGGGEEERKARNHDGDACNSRHRRLDHDHDV